MCVCAQDDGTHYAQFEGGKGLEWMEEKSHV